MLPGFGGYLVSECFLELQIARDRFSADLDAIAVRRRLRECRRRCRSLGPASSVRAICEVAALPLVDAIGFGASERFEQPDAALIVASLRTATQPIVLVVAPWGEPLAPLWRKAAVHAVQRQAGWALLFNGTHLRLVDAGRLYARRFTEFDVDLAIEDDRSFAAFWWLLRADRFAGAMRTVVEQSDRHAADVCRTLRDGVLAASRDLVGALSGRRRAGPIADSFEQALTIVYRLLFLLFAEARGLVPLWHPVYRESYSVDALREAAERSGSARGFWEAVRAMTRLAHAGCRAGDLRVTPFNGRLFAPSRTPLVERRHLDDEAARRAVLALSTRTAPDRCGRERIAYRDLGVEQLGAVYETLLDYEPRAVRGGVALERGSGVRKATGTFYTPQPIAEYLVRQTLGPLVRDASPDRILALRIVDPAMGSGAFLVAACRYLAAAYEQAIARAGQCHASDVGEAERASIRRMIAERCLYGVDLNPMAVQLGRLSLWLATLAADRPLTFLDHHLQVGDSLVGGSVHLLARPPIAPRRARRSDETTLPLFGDEQIRGALQAAVPIRFALENDPDDTLEQVRAKERALALLGGRDSALAVWKRVADLWCAIWFSAPGTLPAAVFSDLSEALLSGRGSLPVAVANRCLEAASTIAAERRFFHWELEFPEAFFDRSGRRLPAGGFDAVIGNPPWDMMRADSGPAESRSGSRADVAPLVRFARDSGIYTAQSGGHANRYQLFVERALSLTRAGGRIGLVLPSGLVSDHGSSRLRARLLGDADVDAIVGFDNQRAVFPIHRSVRFLLVTATAGAPTRTIALRLGERDPGALEGIDERIDEAAPLASASFPVRLTPDALRHISGDTLSIPDLRAPIDLAIVERAATLFRPLGDPGGWNLRFGRELNATDDRGVFRTGASGLPVVEGKQLQPFHVQLESVRYRIADRDARRLLGPGRHDRPRLAYRDVASATNRQTLIAAILPGGCVSTHTLFCLRTALPSDAQHFLCGVFNSFVVNYLVRLRVTTHVTTAIVEALPIPERDAAPGAFREIAALARLLARRPGAAAMARLQARVAGLYQLTTEELAHILNTFPLIPREERDAAFAAYRTNAATETLRARR